ncbi:hypothetical protein NHX12_024004 [Muraenolepis orangiensis]|uniref:Uncharacterized protein n=1 Tax=Muraenolepis orangiensis TaxID=630683 RepID=A0A9Q0EPP6_9TELE|nr:hypothetical protein NHX12_024004 [Muraenolepis orangiensis]
MSVFALSESGLPTTGLLVFCHVRPLVFPLLPRPVRPTHRDHDSSSQTYRFFFMLKHLWPLLAGSCLTFQRNQRSVALPLNASSVVREGTSKPGSDKDPNRLVHGDRPSVTLR